MAKNPEGVVPRHVQDLAQRLGVPASSPGWYVASAESGRGTSIRLAPEEPTANMNEAPGATHVASVTTQ